MPDGIGITGVTGLEDLLRRLDRIPLVLSRSIARDALQEAGELIQAAAERNAAQHRRTGDLEDDIVVITRVSSDFRSNRVQVGPGYPGPGLKTRKRGRYAGRQDSTTSPGVYGAFLERGHGHPGYSWRQRRRTGREIELGAHDVPPQPWLKPAFDETSDAAVQILSDRTAEGLSRINEL